MDLLAPTHLLLILVVALLVLGPKRLPEAAKSLGRGLRDFRDAMNSYSPGQLMADDEPRVHAAEADESELRREPPIAAATAQSPPPAEGVTAAEGATAAPSTTPADAAPTESHSATTETGTTGTMVTEADTAEAKTPVPDPAAASEEETQVLDGQIVHGVNTPHTDG
jgi:sec-independent protein translocase protein TatA